MEYPGFCGPTYSLRSISAAVDRSINLMPENVEHPTGKSQWILVGTPGLRRFAQAGAAMVIRTLHNEGGRVLTVAGSNLYELSSNGDLTLIGSVQDADTPASIAYNGTQYFIVSGTRGYLLVGNTLTQITPEGFTAFKQVVFLDGYFVALEAESRKIWISGLYDGATWEALEYKLKESSPDNVVAIAEDHGELWCFGDVKSEVWWNSGNPDFPLERAANGRLEVGCGAPWSVAKLDNAIFWLGNDERGNRVVWRATGYSAVRVSNYSIENFINRFGPIDNVVGWCYQEAGHSFYCLQWPDAPPNTAALWTYDVATNMWHERAWWDKIKGIYETHRARCHCFAWDKHLVGDRNNGKIYEQKLDYYDDDGDRIRRIRMAPHLSNEMRMIFYHRFMLDMEVAVGLGVIPTSQYGPDMFGQEYET